MNRLLTPLARLLGVLLAPLALVRGIASLLSFAPTTTAYPPRPGTITDDGVQTISRYLESPTLLTRRLRDITTEQFIGDRILTGRATSRGGMVAYEVSESIYPIGEGPEVIEPGGEFPTVLIGVGRTVLEALRKIGLATEITLESVLRSAWDPVDRGERKLRNSMIQAFDLITLGKVAAAVPDMKTLVGAPWSGTDASIVRQIMTAVAMLRDDRQGYNPDTVLIDNMKFVDLASNEKLLTMLARYNGDNAPLVLTNRIALPGLGLDILPHPTSTVLADPIVYDSSLLGSIVREDGNDPDPTDNGVAVETRYYNSAEVSPAQGSEVWRLAVKRTRLPIIQEPDAAVVIAGTSA